jgi:hypothetical protein
MKNYFVLTSFLFFAVSSSFSQNVSSTKNGNWNDATVWSNGVVPTISTNVTIANGHTVAINVNALCNSLLVGTGSAARLNFSGNTARTLSVTANVTVSTSATLNILSNSNATHTVELKGNLINNGICDLAIDNNSRATLLCTNNGNQTLSGSGSLSDFHQIRLNMGTSGSNMFEVTSSSFTASVNFLILSNGTFKLSTPNAATLVPFTGAGTIPLNAGLWINSATAVVSNSAAINLSGMLTVSAGSLDIGNGNNEDLISTGGTVNISGGSLDIAGKYNASTGAASTFSISGGVLLVPSVSTGNTGIAPFHMSVNGSSFNMTDGLIVLRREGGTGAQDLGFLNTGATNGVVTGGTLQLGTTNTPASQTISINSSFPIYNLAVASGSVTARLFTNSLTVNNNLTISSGTLNANNLNLNVGGNWSNAGTFVAGTNTVTFNSNAAQSILKSGGETFNGLNFSGSGVKSFAAPILANASFSIASGATVDVSALSFSLNLKRNFTNNGTFNARSGLVSLTGTVAQLIGGTSITNFYDLTLNNTSGASLSSAQNLKNALTLSNGTFNTNAQVFTMISDINGTARVAPLSGTGDITGNVTVQRFALGGTTGWAFLGTPISSALTLNDWDDDIAISCATCPDGSAGGFLSVYSYNETAPGIYDAAASYVPLSTINDPITSGKGYWVYLGNGQFTTTDITLDVTGSLRKNNYSIPLAYTNTGSSADDGWNLITNPYPSAISWNSLRGGTANLDDAIYVYNADLNAGTGGFASFVNGVSSPALGSGGIGDNIPMCQGIFVHSTGATAINAQESNKVTSNPTFLKPSSSNNQLTLLRLLLKGSNSFADESVLYFDANASNGFDQGYDSYKMRGQDPLAPSIALENNSEVFQINGVIPVSGNFTMALKTLTGYSGTYTITTENSSSFPQGACIHLYDKFTNTSTDLRTNDYSFTLSDTTTLARFILSISILPLSISDNLIQPSCSSPGKGQVIAKGQNAGPWNYYWSLNGSVIKTSLNKNGADTLENLSSGTIDLEMNSVGLCDNNQSAYVINPQVSITASFVSGDTLDMDLDPSISFTNTSVNSVSDYWYFGSGQGTSNAQSPSYTYTSSGTYLVKLIGTSTTGCIDSVSKTLVVLSNLVSVSSLEKEGDGWIIKNFQNNSFQVLNTFETPQRIRIKLYDLSGREVSDYGYFETDVLSCDLDLSHLPQGIYFVKLSGDQLQKVIKLSVN